MIQIRAFFKWQEATPEQAYNFCIEFMNSIQTTHIREEKIKIINKNHLKGITFEALEKEVKEKPNGQMSIYDFIGDEI